MKIFIKIMMLLFLVAGIESKANTIENKNDRVEKVGLTQNKNLFKLDSWLDNPIQFDKTEASPDCVIAVIGKDRNGNTYHESLNLNNPKGGTTALQCAENVRGHLQYLESIGVQVISFIMYYE